MKNKKSFFIQYGTEIFFIITLFLVLIDMEINPENILAGFWMNMKIFDKIVIVALLIFSVVMVHFGKARLKKWLMEYALLILIIEFTAFLPFLGHKALFFNDSPLKEADLLSFYGTYLSFVGALSLGVFLYKREEKNSCGEGIREAAFLEEGMEEISKKFMKIEYYAKNGITLPMVPQWEMYYNSLAKHIGYKGADLYMELEHFFKTVSELNNAIETRSVEDVRIIYEAFLQYEYYNCGAYNYVEAKGALNAISNGKFELKTWLDDEWDLIRELEEKYYDVVELWIYNYMAIHQIDKCKLIIIEKELVDELLKNLEIERWIKCECEKRRIVYVVENISCDMSVKSSILNYSSGTYSRKY